MKSILKIFCDNREISKQTLINKGIYEEVINDIKEELKSGKSWGQYDNEITWKLYACK
jgi:hypothetical protein